VVLITHKINILATADKILVMAAGVVQSYGPRDEILSRLAGPRAVPSPAPQTATANAPPQQFAHIAPGAAR
jgi:ATP-binding cassette subfamily C protein